MMLTIALLWSSVPLTLLITYNLRAWRRSASVQLLYALALGTAGWCVAYSFELLSARESTKLLWAMAQYPFIGILPVAWMGLALTLWRNGRAPSRALLWWLAVVPALTQPLVWTNGLHHLVWRSYALEPLGSLSLLRVEHGPAFWVFNVYCMVVLGAGLLILCALAFTNRTMSVSQRIALLAAAALPALGNVLYTLRIGPLPGLDLTPLAFSLSALAAGHVTHGAGFLNIVLMARDMVLEQLPESVFVLDSTGLVVDVNGSARLLTLASGGRRSGGRLTELLPVLPADWERRLRSGGSFRIETGPDEARHYHSVRGILLHPGDGIEAGQVVIVTDITGEERVRRELEQARQDAEAGSRAKSRFLATMSHEIRTPLNGILGMAQLIVAEPVDAGIRAQLDTIIGSGDKLLAVLSDILDVAEAESGTLKLQMGTVSIRQLLGALCARHGDSAAAKGLLLEQQIDASVPPALYGDARRVEQILSNLISNAIKFTVNGKVGVSAWWLDQQASNGYARLVIAVSDTGIGIPAAELDGIFALFQQVDASNARSVGGSGLGLAIVRHLTALMGGRVVVESEPGRGSIFTVELPLAIEPQAASLGTELLR